MDIKIQPQTYKAQIDGLINLRKQLRTAARELAEMTNTRTYWSLSVYARGKIAGRQRWIDLQLKTTQELLDTLLEKEGITHDLVCAGR